MEFKKIESFLEEILNDKKRVIDLLAEVDGEIANDMFDHVEIQSSVFIGSKATIFIGLYAQLLKEIVDIDFDTFKDEHSLDKNVFLSNEVLDDLIIDIGRYLTHLKNEKDNKIIKKYKTHSITVFDLKNVLKWFETCKNNKLRVLVI